MMVKICGITTIEDAQASIDAGADALGFNFYRKSPRYIDPHQAGAIDAPVIRVGVFKDEPLGSVRHIARIARLDIVQLHGGEAPEGLRVWRAFNAGAGVDASVVDATCEAVLVDSPAPGSGQTFDWTLLPHFAKPIVLAGGLDASNVAEAIRIASPWGVDACSRLEKSPGIKDHAKVRDFVKAARNL